MPIGKARDSISTSPTGSTIGKQKDSTIYTFFESIVIFKRFTLTRSKQQFNRKVEPESRCLYDIICPNTFHPTPVA